MIDLEAAQGECNEWKNKYELMAQKNESLEIQMDGMRKDLSSLEIGKAKIEAEKAIVMDKLAAAETAQHAAENEASRIQALLLQAQSDLSATQSSLQTAKRDNDRLNSRVDEKDRQLDARDADLNKVNAYIIDVHVCMFVLIHRFDDSFHFVCSSGRNSVGTQAH